MKVFIADSSKLFHDFLLTSLAGLPEVEVIGHTGNAGGVIRSLRCLRPEVVMLESRVSDNDGLDVLKQIKSRDPAVKVIIVSHSLKEKDAVKFFNAGADYFLDKFSDAGNIVDLFKTLH